MLHSVLSDAGEAISNRSLVEASWLSRLPPKADRFISLQLPISSRGYTSRSHRFEDMQHPQPARLDILVTSAKEIEDEAAGLIRMVRS